MEDTPIDVESKVPFWVWLKLFLLKPVITVSFDDLTKFQYCGVIVCPHNQLISAVNSKNALADLTNIPYLI
jgi:hypothetical protein